MDDKLAQYKFRQWHFWWLVVFSFLLIVIFVWYLPTRFLHQVSQNAGHGESEVTDEHIQEDMEAGTTEEEMHEHMKAEEMGGEMKEMMPVEGGDEHAQGGYQAIYSEESSVKQGLAVNLNISPTPFNIGVPLSFNFFVNQKSGNLPAGQAGIPVLANKLQIEHEKLMHVLGVRSDMNEFFHIHPEFLADNPSIFSIDHVFDKPGFYKVWSGVKSDGINYYFGHPEVNINGLGSREEKKVSFARNVIVGNYQVSIEAEDTAVQGREIDLSFDIHTLTGQEVEVEQYLGADMHLAIIKDDLSQFMHTHPNGGSGAGHSHSQSPQVVNVALAHGGEGPAGATDKHQTTSGGDEVISFRTVFPEAGLYKAFAQFRPKGIDLAADQALVAEFWIQVEEKAALPISPWWMLLVVSAILIAGLSWWVNNYLKVKPEDIKIKNAK